MGSAGRKWLILLALGASVAFVMTATDFGQRLSLSSIQNGAVTLKAWVAAHYVVAVCLFAFTYIVVNLWFPAAAVLTLLAGFLYGTVLGALYVDGAAAVGAVVAFMMSLGLARFDDVIPSKGACPGERDSQFSKRWKANSPWLVNFLAGVTKVRLIDFAWTTALGSLPSILIFCYAGRQLMGIESVDQVLTFEVVMAFALLAVFVGSVTAVRWAMKRKRG